MKKLIAAVAIAASAMAANARSLIHYFDFDTPSGNGLAYTGVDKGTIPANFTLKGSSVPRTSGALGSDYAYYSSAADTAIWLGDGSASLGCGTTKGFTISFWLKTSKSHPAWTDFFGFRVGGLDYRCEYTTDNTSAFTVYYTVASTGTNPFVGIPGASSTGAAATAGEWRHAAFVFTPNGTNNIATCALYVGGEKIGYVNLRQAGDLQQIHIGSWVRALNGADRKSSATNTGIDELAVFDYPVTAEQVKWLAKYKPAQPASGPGRAMPICWLLDTGGDSTDGVQPTNYGTGTDVAYKWDTNYASWTGIGAFGSTRSFHLNNNSTFRVDGASATEGLGASLLSGMTLSFWIKAPASTTLWRDFMSFRIGNSRYERFEWCASNPMRFTIYGATSASGQMTPLTANTWQNVCMTWNSAESKMEFYIDGVKTGMTLALNNPTDADVLKSFTIGCKVFGSTGGTRSQGSTANVYLDEVAIFNHSVSPAQALWLAHNVPCLPPFDTTNLVRTVSANGAWAGGLASWTVREWDDANEAWANTTRTTIYPALEDTEAEVAVVLANGVELTNDTFVTPKKLVMTADGASQSAATLKATADSRFAPEALEIGEGLQLTVPLYDVKVGGTLTLGAGSKITFDVSNYDGIGEVALTAGGIALPSGETDALTHFAVTDNRFELSLSADGKIVYAKLNNVAATATWTGAGDGTSLNSAANWECRNSSGVVLGDDALPCELTRVIVCSTLGVRDIPAGTAIPWQYLRIEAGNATLAADSVDWRGIPVLYVPEGVTVDLNGKELHLNGQLDGKGTITSSVAGGELHIDVPEGTATTNATVAFTGSLKLVKDGDGTFTAACAKQSYTGGTEIADGTLKLGTSNLPLGAKNASVKICAGAVYDMNGCFSTSSCIYAYDLAGTMRSQTATESYGWNNAYRILGGTFVVSGDDARLELSNVYFACPDGTAWFTMNGHTLTFDGTNYVGLGAFRSNDYGKWVFSGGDCCYEWLNGYGPTNVDVEVHAPAYFKLKGNADVKGLVYEGTVWEKYQVVSHLLVYGRYLAGPCHLPINMRNGSTLDLSAITGSFDLTNAVANTTAYVASGVIGDMTFQSGTAEAPSIININLAGKTDLNAIRKSESPYVVTWNAAPANVDFVIDAQSKANGYRISPDEKGLRLERYVCFMILVR